MTVGTKMHQALTSLQTLAGDMKSFALETEDKTAKQMFANYAEQLENIANGFRGRVDYIEQQEPQYKVMQQAQQKQ